MLGEVRYGLGPVYIVGTHSKGFVGSRGRGASTLIAPVAPAAMCGQLWVVSNRCVIVAHKRLFSRSRHDCPIEPIGSCVPGLGCEPRSQWVATCFSPPLQLIPPIVSSIYPCTRQYHLVSPRNQYFAAQLGNPENRISR